MAATKSTSRRSTAKSPQTQSKGVTKSQKPKANNQQLMWGGIALVAVGTAGYLGWRHFRKRSGGGFELFTPPSPVSFPTPSPISTPRVPVSTPRLPSVAPGFPLKKGSRGTLVTQLQQGLMNKYGRSILPRWGADGIWGNETQNALLSKGLPTTINQSDFQRITGSGGATSSSSASSSLNPSSHARALISAIIARDFSKVDRLLGQMRSVSDYSSVNSTFRTIRLYGVRHTLVTALFKYFNRSFNRETIKQHLLRMGLKYDGRVWSLSGLGELMGSPIITTRPTTIWDGDQTTVEVPAEVLLGNEIESADGFTRFQTLDNHELIVHSNAIAYAS